MKRAVVFIDKLSNDFIVYYFREILYNLFVIFSLSAEMGTDFLAAVIEELALPRVCFLMASFAA